MSKHRQTCLTQVEDRAMPLTDVRSTCRVARRFKTLGSLTSYDCICEVRTSGPDRFVPDPIQRMPDLNT